MRELSHDSKLYAAYRRDANRLREQGAHIHRIVLETELKREYQQWLQDHNRGRSDSVRASIASRLRSNGGRRENTTCRALKAPSSFPTSASNTSWKACHAQLNPARTSRNRSSSRKPNHRPTSHPLCARQRS